MGPRAVRHEIRGLERICAQPLDHGELQAQVGELIAAAVPYDVAIMGTVDPASLLETSCLPIGMPYDAEREAQFLHLEYTSGDPLSYAEVANRTEHAGSLCAEVDDLGGVRRYAELLGPLGVGDELRAMFVADGHCWGSTTLYRGSDSPPFANGEVALLTGVSDVVPGRCDGRSFEQRRPSSGSTIRRATARSARTGTSSAPRSRPSSGSTRSDLQTRCRRSWRASSPASNTSPRRVPPSSDQPGR